MSDILKTDIEGLLVHPQKVVGDSRGLLAEMLQSGAASPLVAGHGIGNVYASIATGKHVARAAHFHFRNHEIFYTLTGSALWLFHDFREGSPTFGKSVGLVLGFDRLEGEPGHDSYLLADGKFAGVEVPVGVYHAFWPLSEEKVVTVAVASVPHDDADYDRRPPQEVPGFPEILAGYGIALPG